MDSLATTLSAIASLAWPVIFAILALLFYEPIKALVDSAKGRKFTIKVAGNELTMEEASEIQRHSLADIQAKLVDLEARVEKSQDPSVTKSPTRERSTSRILWVDDNPKNNSFLVAALEDSGSRVDIAIDTNQGINLFKNNTYDAVVSDMGRPEGDRAGIDFTKRVRTMNKKVPIFVFCGGWATRHLREETLAAGANGITSSGTSLLAFLTSSDGS
jgi:CheY-like chemotaxis protein